MTRMPTLRRAGASFLARAAGAAVMTVAGAALLAAVAATPAGAQSRDVQRLTDTVERLERQLQTLERTVYRGERPPASASGADSGAAPASVSELQITTTQIEDQVRQLTGRIEEMDYRIRQLSSRLDKLVADVDFRLQALEGGGLPPQGQGGNAAPAGSGGQTMNQEGAPGPVGVIGTMSETQLRANQAAQPGGEAAAGTQQASAPVDLPAGSAAEQYEFARSFLIRRDYDGAAQAFDAFVQAHPEDKLAGNAQYWLGETYYVRGDYANAARTFAEGFQKYPDSSKAPDNLLKLGMSLGALDRKEDACITLKKLRGEYPQAPTSIVQRADREIEQLKCG